MCYRLMFLVSRCRPLSISERVSDLNLSVMSVCMSVSVQRCMCVCVLKSQWSDCSLTLHRRGRAVLQLRLFFIPPLVCMMFVREDNTRCSEFSCIFTLVERKTVYVLLHT